MVRKLIYVILTLFIISACGLSDLPIEDILPTDSPTEGVEGTSTFTLVPTEEIATESSTPTEVPPTDEPTGTVPPTAPTNTDTPTDTPNPYPPPPTDDEDVKPSQTPTTTATSEQSEQYPYEVQQGSPVAMPYWVDPNVGCNWVGVAGQLFDNNGEPVTGLIVEAGGTLYGQPVIGLSLAGLNDVYGPGGYEIKLGEQTVASQGQVWVQLKNDAADELSPKVFIDTFDDCDRNLTLLNFVETE